MVGLNVSSLALGGRQPLLIEHGQIPDTMSHLLCLAFHAFRTLSPSPLVAWKISTQFSKKKFSQSIFATNYFSNITKINSIIMYFILTSRKYLKSTEKVFSSQSMLYIVGGILHRTICFIKKKLNKKNKRTTFAGIAFNR